MMDLANPCDLDEVILEALGPNRRGPHGPTTWDLAAELGVLPGLLELALDRLRGDLVVECDEFHDGMVGDYRRWRLVTPGERARFARRMEVMGTS